MTFHRSWAKKVLDLVSWGIFPLEFCLPKIPCHPNSTAGWPRCGKQTQKLHIEILTQEQHPWRVNLSCHLKYDLKAKACGCQMYGIQYQGLFYQLFKKCLHFQGHSVDWCSHQDHAAGISSNRPGCPVLTKLCCKENKLCIYIYISIFIDIDQHHSIIEWILSRLICFTEICWRSEKNGVFPDTFLTPQFSLSIQKPFQCKWVTRWCRCCMRFPRQKIWPHQRNSEETMKHLSCLWSIHAKGIWSCFARSMYIAKASASSIASICRHGIVAENAASCCWILRKDCI